MSNWQEDQAMERVMRFTGKTRREVRNPCLSANDTIALANRIARERADAQAEIARLRGALEVLETDAHFIFNNPPGETSQDVRDVIEWFAGSIRVALEQAK